MRWAPQGGWPGVHEAGIKASVLHQKTARLAGSAKRKPTALVLSWMWVPDRGALATDGPLQVRSSVEWMSALT